MKNSVKNLLSAKLQASNLTANEAQEIFLQALPELSEPLKSAVEFTLANWHKLGREFRASDAAINFFASLPKLPTNDVDEDFAAKLNEQAKILRDDDDVWLSLADLPHEEWRDVVGYEGRYKVSNFGRVKSFYYGRETIRKNCKNYKGYSVVKLHKNDQGNTFLVHVLVAKAFIPKPEGKREINHRIADKENNCVFNLEWMTHVENMQHASKMGLLTIKEGPEASHAKLTEADMRYIRKHFIKGDNEFGAHALARKFNLTPTTILDVVYYRTHKNIV